MHKHRVAVFFAAAALFFLFLCIGCACADTETMSDANYERDNNGIPYYALKPETTYVIGGAYKANAVLAVKVGDIENIAAANASEYANSVRASVLDVWPDAEVSVSYAYFMTTVQIGSWPSMTKTKKTDVFSLSGLSFTTGEGSYLVQDIRVNYLEVEYRLCDFTINGESYINPNDDGGAFFPSAMYRFITQSYGFHIASYAAIPPDRFAYVNVSWDYPGTDRDLPDFSTHYQEMHDALERTQSYNYTPGYRENALSDAAFTGFDIHSTLRMDHDIIYFFYAGRGDSGGMVFTDGSQEEYVPFSTFAQQAARIPCNCILILDVVTEQRLTEADLAAFDGACAAIAAAGERITVLGCINDMNLSRTAHLHWDEMEHLRFRDSTKPGCDSSLFIGAFNWSMGNIETDGNMDLLKQSIYSRISLYRNALIDFSFRLSLYQASTIKGKTVFSPYHILYPLLDKTCVPGSMACVPVTDQTENDLYGFFIMVDADSKPAALDELFSVTISPSDAICQCYTCEIVANDFSALGALGELLPQGRASVEEQNGKPVLIPEEAGVVTLRVTCAGNPSVHEDLLIALYRAPKWITPCPGVIVLSIITPSASLVGLLDPVNSWPNLTFESMFGLVEVQKLLFNSATVTALEPEGVDIITIRSTVTDEVIAFCPVVILGVPETEKEYAVEYVREKVKELELRYRCPGNGPAGLINLPCGDILIIPIDPPVTQPHIGHPPEKDQTNPNISYYFRFPNILNPVPLSGMSLSLKSRDAETVQGYTVIGSYACSDLTDLVYAGVGRPVHEIRSDAFTGCTSLRYVLIPDNVKTIGANALPAGVEIAGDEGSAAQRYAASHGLGFTAVSVWMPETQEAAAGAVFVPQISITPSWISELGVTVQSSDETVLAVCGDGRIRAYKDGTAVLTVTIAGEYEASCTVRVQTADRLILPAGTESVENEAFRGTGVRFVTLSEDCVSIGEYAFADCAQLLAVEIPAGAADRIIIAESAFDGSQQVTFVCPTGTAASDYADAHGIPWGSPDGGSL